MEFSKRLKANADTADIPVLMLTARGYKVPASDLMQTNITALMDKPFSPRDLIARVAELIGTGSADDVDEGHTGMTAA